MLGRKVSQSETNEINLINQQKGIYLLKIFTEKSVVSTRVVKN
jgi:hypothetical protein